jgi:hypothetical protein
MGTYLIEQIVSKYRRPISEKQRIQSCKVKKKIWLICLHSPPPLPHHQFWHKEGIAKSVCEKMSGKNRIVSIAVQP